MAGPAMTRYAEGPGCSLFPLSCCHCERPGGAAAGAPAAFHLCDQWAGLSEIRAHGSHGVGRVFGGAVHM